MTTSTPAWTLTDRLRKARELAGLTQLQLAQRLGIGKSTVANYENDVTVPKRPVLVSWALATGTPLEWLQKGESGDIEPDGPSTQGVAGSAWNVRYMHTAPPFTCEEDLSLAVTAA